MCCIRLTDVRPRQNEFTQSELNSLKFGVRIKTLITKLKYEFILEGKTVSFLKRI